MPYQVAIPGLSSVRGTHLTPGAEYVYFVQSGASPGVYRAIFNQAATISESYGVVVNQPAGKQFSLNTATPNDLVWSTQPGNKLRALNNTRIVPLLSATAFDAITPEELFAVNWNATAVFLETGNSTTGNFYAVRIPAPLAAGATSYSYAKVRIYNDGTPRIDWMTYLVAPSTIRVNSSSGDWYDIAVSEYESTIYLSGVDDTGAHCVARLDRGGAGPYSSYTLTSHVNVNPLVNPRQMVIDGDYIYVVDSTSLWRIDSSTNDQVEVVTGLTDGMGLLLDVTVSGITAYISEVTGAIRVVDLSGFLVELYAVPGIPPNPIPAPTPEYSLGGESGFMSWATLERNAILIADQSGGRIVMLELGSGNMSEEATGLTTPWSVEVLSPIENIIASASEIGINRRQIEAADVLLLGIGLVPFDSYIHETSNEGYIADVLQQVAVPENAGRANTSSAPGYYFWQHPFIPFGGNLSLQLNHELAAQSYTHYRVTLTNINNGPRTITESYVNLRWNGTLFASETIGTSNNRYPIRNDDDLWYNPFLAAVIRTTTADNGHNVLRVEFFTSAAATSPALTEERLILVDNTRYSTVLQLPRQGSITESPAADAFPTLDCGCIAYDDKSNLLEIDFNAWHPRGVGEYRVRFYRGNTYLASLEQVGEVTSTAEPLHVVTHTPLRVGHLVGSCNVANLYIDVSVSSRVIDGFGWVNLGSSSVRSFTLAPSAAMTNSPWVDPG